MEKNLVSTNPVMLLGDLDGPSEYIESLFTRFEFYGRLIFEISNGKYSGLTILVPTRNGKFESSDKSKHVTLIQIPHPARNPYYFSRIITKEFRNGMMNPSIFVLSHPYKSPFLFFLIQLISGKKFRYQMQIHGHIFVKPSNYNLLSWTKYLLLIQNLKKASSIRFASKILLDDFRNNITLGQINYLIAPIPIDFIKIPKNRSVDPFTVGIIGRFQEQRGIDEALKIALAVTRLQPKARFVFIGDGPLESKIRLFLTSNKELSNSRLEHFMNNENLRARYSELGVLLSCAPTEGYGLTIREAALSGIPVLARKSQGAETAALEFPNQIQIYSEFQEAILKLKELLESSQDSPDLKNLQVDQRKRDLESSQHLVKSWI